MAVSSVEVADASLVVDVVSAVLVPSLAAVVAVYVDFLLYCKEAGKKSQCTSAGEGRED
jgi:hypothetical protein